MSCSRLFCFILDKILKSLYTLLLIVIMTLWIVLSVEAGRQLLEVQHKTSLTSNNQAQRIRPEDARRLPGSFASTAAMITVSKASIGRLYALTVFNTILEEFIALCALISLFMKARKLFNLSLVLLIVIWFIEQYRISDLYNQIDYIDYPSSRLIIATHVIHFLIILIGIMLSLTDNFEFTEPPPPPEGSTSTEALNKAVSSSFVDLEHNAASGDDSTVDDGLVRKARCAWMRNTFVKRRNANNNANKTKEEEESNGVNGKSANGTKPKESRKQKKERSKSQVTVIGLELPDEHTNQATEPEAVVVHSDLPGIVK